MGVFRLVPAAAPAVLRDVWDPVVWLCPGSVMVWLWDGSWATERVKLVAPPRVPNPKFPAPTRNLLARLGTLKVETPSPGPHVVPMIAYNAAYMVRDTAVPSHTSHPVGSVADANAIIMPDGLVFPPEDAPVLSQRLINSRYHGWPIL